MTDDRVSFGSGSGRVMGVLTLLIALVIVGVAVYEHDGTASIAVAAGAVCFGALGWASMLRPSLSVVGTDLVLRNMLETITVPLAAVTDLDVRQVLVVRVGRRKITSSAVGRSRRQLTRDGGGLGIVGSRFSERIPRIEGETGLAPSAASYGALVEEQLRARAVAAREAAGIELHSPEQDALAAGVERQRAVPEIAVLVVSFVACVVFAVV